MEKEKRIEYRLDFVDPLDPTAPKQAVKYFDSVNEAYGYITLNRLYNFTLVKEELIAQRVDQYGR